VLWNIRGTLVDADHTPWTTALTIWAGGKLSSLPTRIINNSVASAAQHERRYGYDVSRRVILPNGFDTDLFRPSAEARAQLRAALDVPGDALLIGLIGRYHPMKEHGIFLRAAAVLGQTHPDVHFVLAGERVNAANAELSRLVEELGLGKRVHLLGRRDDMHVVAAALDIAASASSSGEGFPNVIGEAMSCGVPCVVTDVGDSALVVGDAGTSVQPRDVPALARALDALVTMDRGERARLGARARQRVVERFSLQSVVQQYESLYIEVHDRAHAAQA
jgi:glycosyltransferase involved in cell wall biosynthesis